MYKIYLSPSDQTANKYIGRNTTEAIEMRATAMYVKDALERTGKFKVYCNIKNGMVYRVAESNKNKVDLHICIHSNAIGSKAQKKVAGTRMFYYPGSAESKKACTAIYNKLAPYTPGTSESISTNKTWYEMKYVKAPTVYIETEFHDNPEIAKWIITHKQGMAEKIAQGICAYYKVKYVSPEDVKRGYSGTFPQKQIQLGDVGIDVQRWQKFLKWCGYQIAVGGEKTATFKDNTLKQTKAFQKAHNLEADGIVGKDTIAAAKKVKL